MQPYADERPILKGTQIATKWKPLRNNIWKTPWTHLFPASPLGWWQRDREGMRTPHTPFNNDMVFVDGELLKSVGWEGELDAHSYYIDYKTGNVYIGVDPTNKQWRSPPSIAHWCEPALQSTARPTITKVRSFVASRSRSTPIARSRSRARSTSRSNDEPTDEPVGLSDPATFGKEIIGTLLENVTISYCSRVAGYFRGDGLIIRNSLISDTGTEGIYVIGSSDVLLERNHHSAQ